MNKIEAKAQARADARKAAGKPPSFAEKNLPKVPVLGPLLLRLFLIWDWFSKTRFWHTIQALLGYAALTAMGVVLAKLSAAVPFEENAEVVSAVAQPDALKPAANDMLNALGAASTNSKLENTYYLYAYENGKSAVRVCTDLTEAEFEDITKVGPYKKWDAMGPDAIKEFKADGCVNATILAYNGGCTDTIVFPMGIGEPHNFHSILNPDAERGRCGSPDTIDKLFSKPETPAADGWLWHYMIRDVDPVDFKPISLTNLTCTTSACETAKCMDKACYDPTETCNGFQATSRCGADGFSYNTTGSLQGCDKALGNQLTGEYSQGYCDCGNNRKVWMCGKYAYNFKCEDTCKCNNPINDIAPACTDAGEQICSCNTTVVEKADKMPEWMDDSPQYKNNKCVRSYGRFNTVECEGKTVLSYSMQIDWVVNLFTAAIIIRIIVQVCFFYWAVVEDEPQYRILIANETLFILYFLYSCKHGVNKVNEALEAEYFQGWPWFLSLLDNVLVTIAMLGIAYGADPFPSLGRGKATLFLLWVAALKEVGKLLASLYSTYSKKAYQQVGDRGLRYPFLWCIKKDMPWCIKISQEKFDKLKLQKEKAKEMKAVEVA